MLDEEFFAALIEYARRESVLLRYARRRAARGALRRTDWETLNIAREENAQFLEEAWHSQNTPGSCNESR